MSFVKRNPGYCPICEEETVFKSEHAWLRDHYRCLRCNSIPRQRALMLALQELRPGWKELSIHESSPGGATFNKMRAECPGYSFSHFFPAVPRGTLDAKYGARCEDLEQMTFSDESFDIFITQDVFEHLFNPQKAFAEIARVLKQSGIHIFTVPLYRDLRKTRQRAAIDAKCEVIYLEEPKFHSNPVDSDGSLVTYDWGINIVHQIYLISGMVSTIILTKNEEMGLDAKFLEVIVSEKYSM